jgi:hypothetical protein
MLGGAARRDRHASAAPWRRPRLEGTAAGTGSPGGRTARPARPRAPRSPIRLVRHGIDTFGVTLVTTPEELDRASIELGGYTDYVILRVSEHEHGANGNRAQSLRQIIEHQGYIARSPTPGEREALEAGIGAMGIPQRG